MKLDPLISEPHGTKGCLALCTIRPSTTKPSMLLSSTDHSFSSLPLVLISITSKYLQSLYLLHAVYKSAYIQISHLNLVLATWSQLQI